MNSRQTRSAATVAAILTISMLVPAGVLFTHVWQDNSDLRAGADHRWAGVEYLTDLAPLVGALTEAQSLALQATAPSAVASPGVSGADAVDTAAARVAATDARLGSTLRTTARWTGLQAKIGGLARSAGGSPLAGYRAHVEVTDLALALYDTVRRNSGLNRDPDTDVSGLQQAVAVDMPTAIVRVNRMGDLAGLLTATPTAERAAVATLFGQEVLAVQESVADLTGNLQSAVDETGSSTLSGSLITPLDAFRRGVESMTRGANPGGTADPATMRAARVTLQAALTSLSGVTLDELGRLLEDRRSELDQRRIGTLIAAVLMVLLAVLAVRWQRLGFAGRPASDAAGRSASDPAGRPASDPADRERSGALR